jgi:hypothetical protein
MKLSMTKTIGVPIWVERRIVRTIIACAVMIGIVMFGMMIGTPAPVPGANAGGPAPRQAETSSAMPTQSYEGMITDTRCGAKHSAAIGLAAADCTRACVHGGEQFALVDGDSVYVLEGDIGAVKRMAGQRVRIVGTLNGNKISVSTVGSGE